MSRRAARAHGARGVAGDEREQRAGKYPRPDACGTLVGELLPSDYECSHAPKKYLARALFYGVAKKYLAPAGGMNSNY